MHKQKEASFLLTGAAGHLLANLGVKGLQSAASASARGAKMGRMRRSLGKAWHDRQTGELSTGMADALKGKRQGLKGKAFETFVAPETQVSEHIGRGMGSSMREMSKGRRYKVLKKLRKRLAQNPEVRAGVPHADTVFSGVNRALKKGLPAKGAVQKKSKLQAAGLGAMATGVAAADPGYLAHMGVNKIRMRLAASKFGKKTSKNYAEAGLVEGLSKDPVTRTQKAKRMATDVLVSPAIRDPHKAAKFMTAYGEKNPKGAAQITGALGAFNPQAQRKARTTFKAQLTGKGPTAGGAQAQMGQMRELAAQHPALAAQLKKRFIGNP